MGDGGWHRSRGAVFRHCVFARQRDLLRPVRYHAEQPAPLAAAGRLTVLPIRGDTEATDSAGVIGRLYAHGHTTHEVFALVAGPAAVVLSVVDTDLHVDLVGVPIAVHAQAEVNMQVGIYNGE